VYTFKIGGKATMPEMVMHKPSELVQGVPYKPEDVEMGGALYVSNCMMCHGVPGVNDGGNVPNLGYSHPDVLKNAVSPVDADDVPGEQGLALDELLNRVPGLYAQNRYNLAQGMRLSIRGFGARAGFGVRGIRVLLDGVPLTMPDGQTELDGIDLELVERVEVIRGPAATLYGNSAGGVVLVTTREPPEDFAAAANLRAGGYGYRQFSGEIGGGSETLQGLAAINALRLDGYRDHSEAETNMFTGKLAVPREAGTLTAWLNAIDNELDDPGGLNAAEVSADRRQAAPNNLRFNAGESVQQQRLSLAWEGRPTEQREYLLRLYLGSAISRTGCRSRTADGAPSTAPSAASAGSTPGAGTGSAFASR
jgi:outer membrane receptor for Fe3+-dicitrate